MCIKVGRSGCKWFVLEVNLQSELWLLCTFRSLAISTAEPMQRTASCSQRPSNAKFEGQDVVRLVIRKDIYEDCLVIYPYDVWQSMMSDLRSRLNPYNRLHAQFLREWQSGTAEVQLDANGRLLIPQRLLDIISATKEFTLLGVDNHIELWDKQKRLDSSLSGEQLGALSDQIFNS